MDVNEKFNLIKRNTEEIIGEEELKEVLKNKKKPVVYLGTAVTGKPHIGYLLWAVKMTDFLKSGFTVKVLLADIHGALDNCPWPLLEKRYEYYTKVISGMFHSLGFDTGIEFIRGSEFQLKKDYMFDVLRMSTFVSVHDATKAASEVVKMGDNPKLGGIIYPLLQALDEQYLDADVQYGGVDQRKIMVLARENLPKLGYKPRVEVMTPIIPGLIGKKMSASIEESKIDLLESKDSIEKKMSKAYCPEGVVEENGVLSFLKYVVMVVKGDKGEEFVIERPEKFGGTVKFKTYEEVEAAFAAKKLHPMDLKKALVNEIDKLVAPIRDSMKNDSKLISDAYPAK